MMSKIIFNAIRCPDGTVLESKSRWDYQSHTQADGRTYAVDGGNDYQRIAAPDHDYKNLAVTTEDDHSLIREAFTWKSVLDADGNPLNAPVVRKLKDISDDHLRALVDYTVTGYPNWVNRVIVSELNWREIYEV